LKRWRIGLLGLAVSLLAIYFIVSQVDLEQLGRALLAARYEYVLPSGLLLIAGLVTRAVRWRVLLNGALPLKRAFSITNVSYLVNGVLPLRMGEVARAVLANRADPPVPLLKSASSIIVERMLDLLAVMVLLAFALATSPTLPDEYRTAALVTVPLLLVGFAVLIVLARQRTRVHHWLSIIANRVPVLQKINLMKLADHFLDGLLPLTQPALLLRALLWTILSWGLSVAAGYILMFAFYDRASWSATALYIAAAAFVIAVPAVPGNIGTYEWAVMLAVSAVGYGAATAPVNVSFAVVVHALNLFVYAVMGTIGFLQEGITLNQLTSEVQRMRSTA
jgi:uncharacterized protein (TIRG00374 family)